MQFRFTLTLIALAGVLCATNVAVGDDFDANVVVIDAEIGPLAEIIPDDVLTGARCESDFDCSTMVCSLGVCDICLVDDHCPDNYECQTQGSCRVKVADDSALENALARPGDVDMFGNDKDPEEEPEPVGTDEEPASVDSTRNLLGLALIGCVVVVALVVEFVVVKKCYGAAVLDDAADVMIVLEATYV